MVNSSNELISKVSLVQIFSYSVGVCVLYWVFPLINRIILFLCSPICWYLVSSSSVCVCYYSTEWFYFYVVSSVDTWLVPVLFVFFIIQKVLAYPISWGCFLCSLGFCDSHIKYGFWIIVAWWTCKAFKVTFPHHRFSF